MIVLDTNVVSALMRPELNTPVAAWLNRQDFASIRITVVSLHEIAYGVEMAPQGKRKEILRRGFEELRHDEIGEDILLLDPAAAAVAAVVRAAAERATGYCDVPDSLIAGIALAHGATVATRNLAHFKHFGVPLVDPWAAAM